MYEDFIFKFADWCSTLCLLNFPSLSFKDSSCFSLIPLSMFLIFVKEPLVTLIELRISKQSRLVNWLKIFYLLFNVINDGLVFIVNLWILKVLKAISHTVLLLFRRWWFKLQVVYDHSFYFCVFFTFALISNSFKFVYHINVIIQIVLLIWWDFVYGNEGVRLEYSRIFLLTLNFWVWVIKNMVIWRS